MAKDTHIEWRDAVEREKKSMGFPLEISSDYETDREAIARNSIADAYHYYLDEVVGLGTESIESAAAKRVAASNLAAAEISTWITRQLFDVEEAILEAAGRREFVKSPEPEEAAAAKISMRLDTSTLEEQMSIIAKHFDNLAKELAEHNQADSEGESI